MDKEKLMKKLKIKDYNRELEEVLIKKDFSKETKNLLSSMLYKVENSYEDYKKTKVDVPSKKDLLEELIEIIAKDCKKIEITKPNLKDNSIPEGKKSIINKQEQEIITYQNELALLKAIYKLNTNKFIESNEELSHRAFFSMLNEGEISAKSEIIRDFDGWSWNVMTSEIENYLPNLIYQSMVYLLGYNILNQNKNINLKDLELMLKKIYKPSLTEKILKSVIQVSIKDYVKNNIEEQKVLENNEKDLLKTLKLMEDKKQYIDEITNQKKKYVKEIEKIDKYINDDLALKREYIKQNEKLPQDQRVFSLSDFSEKTENRRNFLENEIKILTDKLKPQNFVREKTKIEKKFESIQKINLEDTKEIVEEFIDLILKAMNMQIQKITGKKDIVDYIYILRYFKTINISKKDKVGDICKKQFEKVEKVLITVACNLKVLNIFSHDVVENYKIYRNIFNTKIIDLESAYIQIDKENTVQIYDENSLEKEERFVEFKELTVKHNKKIRIFL